MLSRFRSDRWQKGGLWARTGGIALLLSILILPLHTGAVLGLVAVGLVLFLVGSIAWLAGDTERWLRP